MTFINRQQTRLIAMLMAAVATLFSCLLLADDTDIYFAGAGIQNIKPNVLFVLDTSSSMANKIDMNGDGDTDDPEDISRIEALHEALGMLLNRVDNVRVGIMRLNGAASPSNGGTSLACKNSAQLSRDGETYVRGGYDGTNAGNTALSFANHDNACYLPTGGPVLFPVADLDAPVSSISGEDNLFTVTVPVAQSSDDAEEEDPGNVVTSNTMVQMSVEQCAPGAIQTKSYDITNTNDDVIESGPYSPGSILNYYDYIGWQYADTGFRFELVDIPVGSKVLSAKIRFTARYSVSNNAFTTIRGDKSNSNSPLSFDSVNNITSRRSTQTTAAIDWKDIAGTIVDQVFETPDMSSIVQEIVDDTNWNPGGGTQPMSFIFDRHSAGGWRWPLDYTDDPARSADLVVSYCTPAGINPDKSWVGLRFQNVAVPQGATITSANISFTSATPNANTGTASTALLDIRVENSDDVANTFSTTFPDRVRDRPLGLSVTWSGSQMAAQDPANPLWVQGDTYKTPELKTLVQSIVNRSGWCGGNSMGFHFEGRSTFPADNLMRAIQSYDSDPGSAPVLNITYDTQSINTTGTDCNNVSYSIPVAKSAHDAREKTDASVDISRSDHDLGNSDEFGMIFSLPVSKKTIVNNARLQFTLKDSEDPVSATFYVNAQAVDHAEDFSSTSGNLTSRPRVLATIGNNVTAQPPTASSAGQTFTLDVKSLVQSVLNRDGWVKDNQIALFINRNNSVDRRSWSYDGNLANAPRLLLDVREYDSIKTVRDRLLEINDTMRSSSLLDWSPIVETLYEASRYWRSKGVHFGKERGMARLGSIQVNPLPAPAIDYTTRMARTLTSHPGSWSGGSYVGPVATCKFSDERFCVQDYISGTPTYISPINNDNHCGKNHTILLTDGAQTHTNNDTVNAITSDFSDFSSCSTDFFDNPLGQRGRCAVEMARSLNNNDIDADSNNGEQTVITHTIGLNLNDANSTNWLHQIAQAGGGQFYTIYNLDQLQQALSEIFIEVLGQSTSLAPPSISTNFFNRTQSSDELYYGLFSPRLEKRWDGNVKRYRLCVNDDVVDPVSGQKCTAEQVANIAVLDRNSVEAIDPQTQLFKDTARSYWSNAVDGNQTKEGGAGSKVTSYQWRRIYTDENAGGLPSTVTWLSTSGFNFTESNWNSISSPDLTHIHGAVCDYPNDLGADSECENKMLWLLGKDVLDEDYDGVTNENRWPFADSLHATPLTVTYGFTDSIINEDSNGDGVPDTVNGKYDVGEVQAKKLLVNTNDGALRMINPVSGYEEWRFMPMSMLANVSESYNNQQGTHLYGMDATPVVHVKDNNNNGVIEPQTGAGLGDTVHLYQVMRRGGDYVYSLDLTPGSAITSSYSYITPRLRWRIQGGTGDYIRMGQSWSRPVVATINVDTDGLGTLVQKEVLIMGGGYDEDLDTNFATSNSKPNKGNAIYIIDPDSGDKLLSISHKADSANGIPAGSGADIEIQGLNHSIVSQITILDSDDDGIDDRLYFPDVAGNVWRVDLGNDISSAGGLVSTPPLNTPLTTVGHLANLSTSGVAADERRLYNDVTAVRVKDTEYTDTTSYTDNTGGDTGKLTYVILTTGYRANPLETVISDKMYALRDKIANRMEDADSDRKADGTGFINPIMDNTTDLASIVTAPLTKIGDTSGSNDASDKRGYSFDFPDPGEKGLSNIVVIFGRIYFTTYVPKSGMSTDCSANIGDSYGYEMSLATGDVVTDQDMNLDDVVDINDRRRYLGAGLASGPQPLLTDQGIHIISGLQHGIEQLGEISGMTVERTYWFEQQD